MSGHGCHKCNRSIGEINIEDFLNENRIVYKTEFVFNDLKYRYPLRFDFAIFDDNGNLEYLIEFNGKQHYDYYPVFHKSREDFDLSLIRDDMKSKYCKDNNINLYIISYKEDINDSMKKILKENEKENRI